MKFFERLFQILCSLKLAVIVILTLAFALAAGTILESVYDTPTSQFWIYRSLWFHGVLATLGLNIFCVAMSRWPWRKRHTPFLLAHLGILLLLGGSWLTEKFGVDGNLRVSEGETASIVDLDVSSFIVSDQKTVYSIPIQWLPPGVSFKSVSSQAKGIPYDLVVDRFMSHADSTISFVSNPNPNPTLAKSAVHLRIVGGAMNISQDFWMWEGSPEWSDIQMGPSRFIMGTSSEAKPGRPQFTVHAEKDGSVTYLAESSEGKKVKGRLLKGQIQGKQINPGWKGNVILTVEEWIQDAMPLTTYKPARVQYGNQAPPPAIHVVASGAADVWLGLGDRAVLHLPGQEISIAYYPKRIVLPFSLRLEEFSVEHDPGTLTPAAYSSRVSVLGEKGNQESIISMNEPLEVGGYTLYQASYEEGDPRPKTSILSVNRDPGRPWKYFGSLLIVLGSVLLFAVKYKQKHKSTRGQLKVSPAVSPISEASTL